MKKLLRFIEIDIQYFKTSLPFKRKVLDILRTNTKLFFNLLIKPKTLIPVKIGDALINYDNLFATKTLLTTVYDFYLETKKASLFKHNPVILDIGANIGQFVVAIKSFYPKAKVYSVEPDKHVFSILEKNATNYSNVTVYNCALSNKKGKVNFFVNKNFSEWSGLKPLEGHSYDKVMTIIEKGDSLFKSVGKIDLIKIDVEGAELEVLQGLSETIKRCEYILIEASILRNSSDIGSKEVLSFLFNNNFAINHIGRIFSDGEGTYQGAVDILLKNKSYE